MLHTVMARAWVIQDEVLKGADARLSSALRTAIGRCADRAQGEIVRLPYDHRLLARAAPAVFAKVAVGANHAVTGNEETEAVRGDGAAHCT